MQTILIPDERYPRYRRTPDWIERSDRRFERIWDFYLAFCEAGFRTRWLRNGQLVLARTGEGPA